MSAEQSLPVLISGAGPIGLTLALALGKACFKVEVFEAENIGILNALFSKSYRNTALLLSALISITLTVGTHNGLESRTVSRVAPHFLLVHGEFVAIV